MEIGRFVFLLIASRFSMAAAWLRIHELTSSYANLVCIVARVQSINSLQRTLILYDDDGQNRTSSSSILNISLVNLRTPMNIQSSILSPGQYVQVYGKVIRQADEIIRVDAQFIRPLGVDFNMNKYVEGLILTRNYMTNVDDGHGENETFIDNSGNPIRTIL